MVELQALVTTRSESDRGLRCPYELARPLTSTDLFWQSMVVIPPNFIPGLVFLQRWLGAGGRPGIIMTEENLMSSMHTAPSHYEDVPRCGGMPLPLDPIPTRRAAEF